MLCSFLRRRNCQCSRSGGVTVLTDSDMSGGKGIGGASLLSNEERRQKIAVERKFAEELSLGPSQAMRASAHAAAPPVIPVETEYQTVEVGKPKITMVIMQNQQVSMCTTHLA